jgi:hypothetical protein
VEGISGRRNSVRLKLSEVRKLVEHAVYESIFARATFDHPETELAYPYNEKRHSREGAREAVMAAYDANP